MAVSAKSSFRRSMSKTAERSMMESRALWTRAHILSLRVTRRKAEVKPRDGDDAAPSSSFFQWARGAARSAAGREKTWSRDWRMS